MSDLFSILADMSARSRTPTSLGSNASQAPIDSAVAQDEISYTLIIGSSIDVQDVPASCVVELRPGDAFEARLIGDSLFFLPRNPTTRHVGSFYAPLNDIDAMMVTVLPTYGQQLRTTRANRPGSSVDISGQEAVLMRLKAGEVVSIECLSANTEVGVESLERFERFERLVPVQAARSGSPSLFALMGFINLQGHMYPRTRFESLPNRARLRRR